MTRVAVAVVTLLAACAAPLRTVASLPSGKAGCAALEKWAEEKAEENSNGKPPREGESSALDDSLEASVCWRRRNDFARARGALLPGLIAEASDGGARGASDAIARKAAAIALSARAAGETETYQRAKALLTARGGGDLDLARGDRRAVGRAGEAVSMIDGECFFCAKAEAYGAQDGEHVEELGRWAGLSYVRRDDGREQFLVATRLLQEGQQPPQKLLAEAMRRRGRPILASTPSLLARRSPEAGEETSAEAPLFHLALHGFAFGDVGRTQREAGARDGLRLVVRGAGREDEVVIRFPPLLLTRAARDRRFVAPPDGVDAVVRYDGREGERPRYRAVILRHEDGVAEGP